MTIRGILFDKDGTLIDCDRTWAPILRLLVEELRPEGESAALLEAAGLDLASGRLRAGSVWGAGSTRDLVALWWPQEAVDADAFDRRRHAIDAICARASPHSSVPLIDLAAMFARLRRGGIVTGIATNDSLASLTGFVAVHGLAASIDHLIGYDSVAMPKPAADMVHAFCAAAALEPQQVAVVGDNVHDLEMGRAAGAGAVIGVLSGNGSHDELAPHADVILDSVAQIDDWLDALPQARVTA